MTRIGIIGDVHGHAKELIDMIGALEAHGIDRLISLGDLVDRGPSSRDALRIAASWRFQARSGEKLYYEIVQGNHEDGYARVFQNKSKPGRQDKSSPSNPTLYKSFSVQDLNLMAALPVAIEVPEMGITCLHGGVEPRTTDLYDPWNLRTRYLDEDTLESLPGVRSSKLWWGQAYDGRYGTIVCGHESHKEPTRYENVIAIDGEGYRKVHGIVISDEPDDQAEQAFSCKYGDTTHKVALVDGDDAERYNSWEVTEAWIASYRAREARRTPYKRAYPSYPRFSSNQSSFDW
jgi:predicted phosphodiesterase